MFKFQGGLQGLLKEGHVHFSGLQQAILKNITACKEISDISRTSLGPNGMKKMIINHLEKIFVTSDAATILKELEVQHPAAKMLVMASQMQKQECGDNTNFVLTFGGELLQQAETLIKMGLHPSQIITGFERALEKALEILPTLVISEVKDIRNQEEVEKHLFSCLSAKMSGTVEFFTKLVTKACISALPANNSRQFNVDNIRVSKLLGGSIYESEIVNGLIIDRKPSSKIISFTNPKICAFGCPLDTQEANTKGTVLIKKAEELLNYTKSEEDYAESIIKSLADAGVNVILCGGSITDIMLHYIDKYKMMVIKVTSKFELRRLCKCFGCTALVKLEAPTPEQIGYASEIKQEEICSETITVLRKGETSSKLCTIVLRGSTKTELDDLERAIENAVNVYKAICLDNRFVYGASTTEMQLANKLEDESTKIKGLDQYSYSKFAQAFQIISRIMIENCGLDANEYLSKMQAANITEPTGLDVENKILKPSSQLNIYDHLNNKITALKLAADAAITILRVDQIIMSKPSGGPKFQKPK